MYLFLKYYYVKFFAKNLYFFKKFKEVIIFFKKNGWLQLFQNVFDIFYSLYLFLKFKICIPIY
jgi:hypothetical protein